MSLSRVKANYKEGKISKRDYIDKMHRLHDCLFEYSEFIRDTDISNIEITDGNVVMTSRNTGIRMICDQRDKRAAPVEILNFDYYERAEFILISKLIEREFTIFDIGANIGWYTLNLSKLFRNANIFSFEPIPNTYNQLKKNIGINKINNVKSFNFGFSDKEGPIRFYYNPQESGNASAVNLSEGVEPNTVTCLVRELDAFALEMGVKVDFIKCDVEGAELFVFQGGLRTIIKDKPIIFAEILRKWSAKFEYHPNEIISLLSNIGYRCFVLKGNGLEEIFEINEKTVETNFFFLHSLKHSDKINSLIESKMSKPTT